MARHVEMTMTDAWVELTNADVTSITIQNRSSMAQPAGYMLEILGTTGAAPGGSEAGILVPPFTVILNESLADLFPGVAGAVRVFGRGNVSALVSHA